MKKLIFITILLISIISVGVVYANGGDEEHSGMMGNWNMMGAGWSWMGWVFMILILIILILLIIVLIKWLMSQNKK